MSNLTAANQTAAQPTELLPEHQSMVESFITSGRYAGPHAVITAALNLLREKERERTARLSALHAALASETPAPKARASLPDLEETSSEIERLLAVGLGATSENRTS